jgi:hypothetical protein
VRAHQPRPVYIGVLGSLSSMPYAQDHGLARYAMRRQRERDDEGRYL